MVDKMIESAQKWIRSHDYNYWGCNSVPDFLFTSNRKWNALIRTFFRLCPINFRKKGVFPVTPQANVALLKAFCLSTGENADDILKVYERVLQLRSPRSKYFALKQGIKIAISLYEDSPEDPTPLNTVWFGQFLLLDQSKLIGDDEKMQMLLSIAQYLTEELGHKDYGQNGIYYYYGHNFTKIVYNASALISSFLIRVGVKYENDYYIEMGRRGIKYIAVHQNDDGSWFYAAQPVRQTIDCFHQSYILQALIEVENYLDFSVRLNIEKGIAYYRTLFVEMGEYVIPLRYDKRYTPQNTWLFVKVDGRDVAEGIVFFSKYCPDSKMVDGLVSYLYTKLFNKKEGYFVPEIFVYGKNRIPYIEFQAWFLYALKNVKCR